ncbi:MAG: MBL fold metallo-hydrolase [Phycisphaerales bacterium]|nr:MBL fold metallo-hydrolase [Phycisphaerales bacterium]
MLKHVFSRCGSSRSCGFAAAVCLVASFAAARAQDAQPVEINTVPVAGNVSMLVGQGGNIGVCVGEDGVFLIDDQFAPLTEKIKAAVAKLSPKPVKFLVNTHWHFDHTGGNENFGKAGAIIVAHENVRRSMSKDQFIEAFNANVPAAPPVALPIVTFTETVTFHFNGDDIRVFHVAPAHTDGDSVIHFARANVYHMGDTYFNGMYPFIDTARGGSLGGMIAAVDLVLKEASPDAKFIPGHGEMSGVAELRAYRQMLVEARDAISPLVKAGKSKEEIVAAHPTKALDEKWGKGILQPDAWVGIVVDGMKR